MDEADWDFRNLRLDLPLVGAPGPARPPPHDAPPDAQPALHSRQQLDQPEVVELRKQHALLALVEGVLAPHFRGRPVIEDEIERREQVRVTGERGLLLGSQCGDARVARTREPRKVVEAQIGHADRIGLQPIQREAAAREHALDARLARSTAAPSRAQRR